MNNLLIFFAFPIAVIIISAILQKVLRNPIAVAALIFAIFLIVTFAAFDETFLIATLAYTILAFITAFIVKLICESNDNNNMCDCLRNILNSNLITNGNSNNSNNSINDILGVNEISNNGNNSSNSNNTCSCQNNRYRRF